MECFHDMPFGAQVLSAGGVRFRLWAPAAARVDLTLEVEGGAVERRAMESRPEGWFELLADDVQPGARYTYRIDERISVPDPAARFQPNDVSGPSEVIDPRSWTWRDATWFGRPWEEVVLYEVHVGTYTRRGDYDGLKSRLQHLKDLGVTAIELMPLADFPGDRNWGYDGVLPFAPESRYGRPESLKNLVESAHSMGLMVFLDVVYNHFGPEGNFLREYAPEFFTDRHRTPWGAGINFDGDDRHWVRQFFIQNALYWLVEYRFDGLRLDAVHAIVDESTPHFLEELSLAVRKTVGSEREVHLVLENDANQARYLERGPRDTPRHYIAQWNDDIHHVLHVLLTSENAGYYHDYEDRTLELLGRCLVEGFAYQGDPSAHRAGALRGEPSSHLPLSSFVSFLQNHDQIGNRAFGERITSLAPAEGVRAATALILLAPSPPLLFMGQEWAAATPFQFFCDFRRELAHAVRSGRRREFASFSEFQDPAAREQIPDPIARETFERSVLDWNELARKDAQEWLEFHRSLLQLRRLEIAPRLRGTQGRFSTCEVLGARVLLCRWALGDRSMLVIGANLGDPCTCESRDVPGRCVFETHERLREAFASGELPAWSLAAFLEEPAEE